MNAENPADVIRRVADELRGRGYLSRPTALSAARALADAGLLADPADRDESGKHFRAAVSAADIGHKRAQRAEAEVERLHSWDGLLELLDEHWPEDIFPTLPDDQNRDPGPRIVSLIRWVAEMRATVDRVRALADEWAGFGTHTWFRQIHVTAAESLHAALDGAGDAPSPQVEGGEPK